MSIVIGVDLNYTKEASCRHCASKISYAESELKTKYIQNYISQKIKQNYVVCPSCGHHIELFTKQTYHEKI